MTSWTGVARTGAGITGVALLAYAIAIANGLGGPVLWATVAGLALLLGAIVGGRVSLPSAADRAPWWGSFLTVRTGIAAAVALIALAMTWWALAAKAAPEAKEVMDRMLTLVTAVLGYLFGRGEAESAQKLVDQAKDAASEVDEGNDQASTAAQEAMAMIAYLAEKAADDGKLQGYLKEAAQQVETDAAEASGADERP